MKERPVRFNAAPRKIKRRAPSRPSSRSSDGPIPPALFWVAGLLLLLLVGLAVVWVEMPRLKDYLAGRENKPVKELAAKYPLEPLPGGESTPAPPPAPPSAAQKEAAADAARQKRLEDEVKAETQKAAQVESPPPAVAPPPPPVILSPVPTAPPPPLATDATPPGPAPETLPPVAQPVTEAQMAARSSAPVRALPLDPAKLDTERIAAYQVALERIHFSCGFIDGDQGMRTQRMLCAFQQSRGLPVTGVLDQPTRDAIGEPGEPFLNYVVTAADLASIMPKPPTWRAKSQATRLGYNDMWEMLAEKFHCTRAYLKALNRDVTTFAVGTEVIGPKVYPAAPIPKAARLRIFLSQTSIEAIDANGRIVGFFPCSIAKDKNKRPSGALTVKSVVPNPDYTFDPALFADAAKAEGLNHKIVLPPGPRNPVGTTWIGLSLLGYGIHGTPEPENISRTQSHGCFRLANWNAEKVLKMVRVGTPVDVEL